MLNKYIQVLLKFPTRANVYKCFVTKYLIISICVPSSLPAHRIILPKIEFGQNVET